MKRIVWMLVCWFVVMSTDNPKYSCESEPDAAAGYRTEDICKDMAFALNEAHEKREWAKKTPQEQCEDRKSDRFGCFWNGQCICTTW